MTGEKHLRRPNEEEKCREKEKLKKENGKRTL